MLNTQQEKELLELEFNVTYFLTLYIQILTDINLGRYVSNDPVENNITKSEISELEELFRLAKTSDVAAISISHIFGIVSGMLLGLPYAKSLKYMNLPLTTCGTKSKIRE